MDQATTEQISNTLAEKIKNPTPRRVFTSADIKIAKNDLYQNVKDYNNALNNIFTQNPAKGNVPDILQKFLIDENNVDTTVLVELDPMIKQTEAIVNEIAEIEVPQSLTSFHLELLNSMEKVKENIENIKLYESDVILALSGITQYEESATSLEIAIKNLSSAVEKRLKN
jgi:hypothetical protein